jgi:hypothetical protein
MERGQKMAKALLFNITDEKRMKLLFLLMQYGIAAVEGKPEDYDRPLGIILGKAGSYSSLTLNAPFMDEMLVLDELSAEQFHGLLNGMQMLQATVTYKAITTEHNLSWTPSRLHRELAAEHAAMNP